jgi:glycosyltransferase involved in cell wall biosynthesis
MQLLEELFSVKPFSLSACPQNIQHPTAARVNPNKKISIAWRGEFFSARSFAHVNRESVLALIKEGFTVEVIPHDRKPEPEVYHWPSVKAIQPYIAKREGPIDVWIEYLAEEIPSLPPAKRLIYLVVWESFLLPQNFVETILQRKAEVWVASSPVYEACLRSKIPAEKLWLIPHGVDLSVFHPSAVKYPLPTQHFTFLFSGVAHYRKGVDAALRAFQEEFDQEEPVSLVIKDAPNSYGWGANLSTQIQDFAKRDPRIIYLVEKFSSSQMASLYAAADVVLAPSRGEGFNLPIIEAMACGKPVISTRTGVACDVTKGILHIDATPVFDPNWSQDRSPLTSAMWLQPDLASLKKQMRRTYQDNELRQKLGIEAQAEAQNYTWEKIGQMMTGRIIDNG